MVTKDEWMLTMDMVNYTMAKTSDYFEPIPVDTLSHLCDYFDYFTLRTSFQFNNSYQHVKEATFKTINEIYSYFKESYTIDVLYQIVKHKEFGVYHLRYCSINPNEGNINE